jgi:hypothetical protein
MILILNSLLKDCQNMHGIAKVHITKPYVISGQAKELALAHVVVVHAALPVLAISLYFSFLLRRGALQLPPAMAWLAAVRLLGLRAPILGTGVGRAGHRGCRGQLSRGKGHPAHASCVRKRNLPVALGTKNREPGTEPKESGTGTERTGIKKFGSCSVPVRREPRFIG